MTITIRDFSEVVDGFYRAAMDEGTWGDALGRVNSAMSSFGVALVSGDALGPKTVLVGGGWKPSQIQEYKTHFAFFDPYVQVLLSQPTGRMVSTQDFFSERDVGSDEYHQEFLIPSGAGEMTLARLLGDEDDWVAFSVHNDRRHGPIDAEQVRLFEEIGSHVARAVQLQRQLKNGEALTREMPSITMLDILERLNCGAVLLDGARAVVGINRDAERLVGDGILIRAGRVSASHPDADAALQQVIGDTLIAIRDAPKGPARAIALPRQHGRPLVAYAVRKADPGAFAPRMILMLVDPDRPHPSLDLILREAYRLTPAEVRLVTRIGMGEDLGQASDDLGIAKETSRTQLKSIFRKMRVRRQAELVALISRIAETRLLSNHNA